MSDYYCTNCGADLGWQYGFDPTKGCWECTSCGRMMINPDDPDFESDVVWICDECGDILNKQYGFRWNKDSVWYCKKCGYGNPLSEDEIYESEAAYQKAKRIKYQKEQESRYYFDNEDNDDEEDIEDIEKIEEDDDSDYAYDSDSYSGYDSDDEYVSYYNESTSGFSDIINSVKRFFSNLWKWIKRIVIFTIALIVLFGAHNIFSDKSTKKDSEEEISVDEMIAIGISSFDALGKQYRTIERQLEERGFSRVVSYEMNDLDYKAKDQEGLIGEISVGDDTSFSAIKKYDEDVRIMIRYHSLKDANPPMSSNDAKKKNVNDVITAFEKAGFGNINTVKEDDLVTGWVVKDGSVESVAIKVNIEYETTATYRVDAEITITYHTFKEKEK